MTNIDYTNTEKTVWILGDTLIDFMSSRLDAGTHLVHSSLDSSMSLKKQRTSV